MFSHRTELTAAIMLPSLATLLSRTLVAYVDSLMSRSGWRRPTHAPDRWRSGTVLKSPAVQEYGGMGAQNLVFCQLDMITGTMRSARARRTTTGTAVHNCQTKPDMPAAAQAGAS
jgi:hypothetical protein